MLKVWIKALRIKQWVKNLLVFTPAVLAGVTSLYDYGLVLWGFILFSLLASGGYLLNDIRDISLDKLHPAKKFRPIPSGAIGTSIAQIVAFVLIGLALLLGWFFFSEKVLMLLLYFTLNSIYAIRLKQERFLDILILASFYLIRIFFGAAILDLTLTGWFVGTFTFASLGLGLSKRYLELVLLNKSKSLGRAYSKEDMISLLPLMYSTVLVAVLFLNIHAFFVLNVSQAWFYALLNLLSFGIILYYFDEMKSTLDDPIERVLKSKWLLLFFLVLMFLYVGMMFYNK
jgi:4-hydroxybenzoate polyprenyltransferase